MRPPRYRFPDGVRSATREMASRMLRDDDLPQTPAELDSWIARNEEVSAQLKAGGYGSAFTAVDLFPLLGAMASHQGAPPPPVQSSGRSRSIWIGGVLVLVIALLLLLIWL